MSDPGRHDHAVYPVCDKMGKTSQQVFVNSHLVLLLRDYFAAEGRPAFVGSNQFFYYRRGEPKQTVSPDVYILDNEERHPASVPNWKVWEHGGKAPALALEILSYELPRDYADEMLERYERLGVEELICYDAERGSLTAGTMLTQFVRDHGGRLVARPTLHDRVQSAAFGFWLVVQSNRSLRLALGPHGEALWPTADERAAAEAAARQLEATARKAAEASRDAEVAAREAEAAARQAAEVAQRAAEAARDLEAATRKQAEAEVVRLRAELERLRRG